MFSINKKIKKDNKKNLCYNIVNRVGVIMKKITKLIRTRWLTILIIIGIVTSLIITINEYLKQYGIVDGYNFSDFRVVYFDMQTCTGASMLVFPLMLITLVIDRWHQVFKNGNIKNYLTRLPYKKIKKKIISSIAFISLLYPAILLIYLIISLILSGGGIEHLTRMSFDTLFDYNLYRYFPIYLILHSILLYIAGITTSLFALLFLNKVKSKILTVVFSYCAYILLVFFLAYAVDVLIQMFFDTNLNTWYIDYFQIWTPSSQMNYGLYLISNILFCSVLSLVIKKIYNKEEKVLMTNEKEMV